MGGRGDTIEQKMLPTQDQLRLARITQDVSSADDDRANIQKLIKKVMETTRCTMNQAEVALFDNDNNVEEAVIAILEESYPDTNVWMEQKSRRTRRQGVEEKGDDSGSGRHRYPVRVANNSGVPSTRGRGGPDRGRGGFRGGARGGARGSYGNRGGYQSSGASRVGGPSGAWENSNAGKEEVVNDWSATANPVDDIPEDTDWKTAGTLVFSRRDGATPPMASALASSTAGTASVTTSSATAPISFAAVAAAGTNKSKDVSSGTTSAAVKAPQISAPAAPSTAPQAPEVSPHSPANPISPSQHENLNSLYQNNGLVSTSSQVPTIGGGGASTDESEVTNESVDLDADERRSVTPPSSLLSAINLVRASSTAAATSVNTATNASADWTTQLKNDLGIGAKEAANSSSAPASHHNQVHPTTRTKPVPEIARSQNAAYTVEFVSGDSSNQSALPEYQFGFHVEQTGSSEERNEDVFVGTKAQLSSHPKKDRLHSEVPAESSILANGTVNDYSSAISSQQQMKGVTTNGQMNMMSSIPSTVHNTVSRPAVASGLSYADTSSMSYPSSDARTSKPSLSLHQQQQQQQQAQHQLYTTTQIPYNSYPYLNMYSPVTGVRQDEAQQYAALVQYPFGMGQIDMSSLSTMLPPAAIASQQPSQPPPPVQNQHQPRPDQHGNYVDLTKAYAAAAAVANSATGAGSGSGILGNQQQPQQQRDSSSVATSTVAPPPGFSGPPSTIPAAAFTLPQHNHLSSLFQMPPAYHPQLSQMPFSFMLPNVTGNGQHKISHQMFAQQAVDESLSDQRMSAPQQKQVHGSSGHQQMDKYGNSSGGKNERIGGGAQATPPPQMYQAQAPQGYPFQQMPLHGHSKKSYNNAPQHWNNS